MSPSNEAQTQGTSEDSNLPAVFRSYRWMPFVLPLAVYLLLTSLEPSPPEPLPPTDSQDAAVLEARQEMVRESGSTRLLGLTILYEQYPLIYTVKIAIVAALVGLMWPAYAQFPLRVSGLAIAVGIIGIVVWVGLCHWQLEQRLFALLGLDSLADMGGRPAYNPLEALRATPAWAYTFLGIRFFGLVIVVPIVEEMFYRAFLMRLVVAPQWWKLPVGTATGMSIFMGTVFPALAHPGELLAALVWFGMVTWLVVKTKNIWDCVAAHAVTNLLLGIYVITFDQWQLW